MPDATSPAGHRLRLRRRFLKNGLGSLYDHEVLELLLTYAIPRRDVKPLAKTLIQRFGSLARVFDATEYELESVPGVGEHAAGLILLMKALGARYLERKLDRETILENQTAVVDFLRMKVGGSGKETMVVLYLDSRRRLLAYTCTPGTINRAPVFWREIMEQCIIHRATAIILAHNHPSGLCLPSPEDVALSRKIRDAAAASDIELLDHLLVTPAEFRSLKQENFM